MPALLSALLVVTALADTPVDQLPAPARERYEAAEAAWSKGEMEAAEAAFGEVIEAAPTFDRAWRRRCGVRLAQERIDQALADCEKAVTLVDGFENRTALAMAMLQDDRPKDAHELIDGVLKEQPDYLPAQVAKCMWAQTTADREALSACSGELAAAAPGSTGALYYEAVAKVENRDVDGAHEALKAAREKGLTDDLVLGVGQRAAALAEDEADRHAKPRPSAASWSTQDLVPLLVVVGLLLTVGVLWLGRDDKGKAA